AATKLQKKSTAFGSSCDPLNSGAAAALAVSTQSHAEETAAPTAVRESRSSFIEVTATVRSSRAEARQLFSRLAHSIRTRICTRASRMGPALAASAAAAIMAA